MSISYLVLIIFFQWFFGFYCDMFPVWGSEGIRYYVLPVICGIVYGVGGNVRFYRSLFANEFHKEYMRTARAKGCQSSKIYTQHLLKNAAILKALVLFSAILFIIFNFVADFLYALVDPRVKVE